MYSKKHNERGRRPCDGDCLKLINQLEARDDVECNNNNNNVCEVKRQTYHDKTVARQYQPWWIPTTRLRWPTIIAAIMTVVHFMLFGQDDIPIASTRQATTQQYIANTSLVIIMGNLRGGEKAWESLYKNVLDVNNADLALMIGEESPNATQSLYPNNTLSKRARYVWTFPEYGDWADAVDLINGTGWRQDILPRFKRVKSSGVFGGIKGCPGSGAIIFMIRWFLNQRLQDDNILEQYDRFVITRSDHYYQCPHIFADLDLNNNKMYIPEGEDYGGYTDRHLVVSRENIYEALDIFPELLRRPYILTDGRKNRGGANPEYILKRVWGEHNLTVSKLKRTFFTTATANDTTRWQKAGDPVPGVEGLFKKYRNEFTLTQHVCFEESFDKSKLSHEEMDELDKWCGHCRGGWGKCNSRVGYLYDKYNASIIDSKLDIMKQGLCRI